MQPHIRNACMAALLCSFATLAWSQASRQVAVDRMIHNQLMGRDIADPRVLESMRRVPRHLFVPAGLSDRAYSDRPLPIGEGQTISQPYIVALMTERLALRPGDSVLEVGTGSGYQAAVLAELVAQVRTIEIKAVLHERASTLLDRLGYDNVETLHADGYFGWPGSGRFDHIIITAAVDHVPRPLLEQLVPGGTMILPMGNPFNYQNLVLITRSFDQSAAFEVDVITGVLFVPMTGHALADQ